MDELSRNCPADTILQAERLLKNALAPLAVLAGMYRKMMRAIMLFFGVITLTITSAAAEQNFTCPQTVTVTETAQNIPNNWRVGHDEAPTRLFYVSMAYADGSDTMSDYEKNLPNGKVKYTWDLNSVVKREPWFVRCEYQQTNILLLIPVPAEMTFCSTTQKNGLHREVENTMHCK
ncbi:MAG: STY0301 family protein [Rhizomicrobium sp.]